MAVTVSIPTILRTHTGGRSPSRRRARPLAEVIDNLEANHAGLKARLVKEGALHRFINVYVNDEDVRFAGGLDAAVADGDTVTILPAVAGGLRPPWPGTSRCCDALGDTPLVGLPPCRPRRTFGCGRSWRIATRPARSRTGPRWP